uniref:Uncharacterized protein n=1 Tax=Setaria italica TaxID=4555 RepID=K3ZFX0_SETIT
MYDGTLVPVLTLRTSRDRILMLDWQLLQPVLMLMLEEFD